MKLIYEKKLNLLHTVSFRTGYNYDVHENGKNGYSVVLSCAIV